MSGEFDKAKSDSGAPIFLVGFMGSGKTTVGRALAGRLHYEFLDLDRFIEERAGKTVSEIFAERGEQEFRRLEREAVLRCRGVKQTVIALGGGAFVSKENRAALRSIGKTVWLDCPLEICLKRLGGDPSRPMLGSSSRMDSLLSSRLPAYRLADYRIETGSRSPDEIAGEIVILLGLKEGRR